MAMAGLEVFDKTLHITNLWLDEISADIGPDRHLAWHVLSSVLRAIRDEMSVDQSAHLAAQLPLLIRGTYFDQYHPATQPALDRSHEEFIDRIQQDLGNSHQVSAEHAATAVMQTINRHVTEGQVKKIREALPKKIRALWPEPAQDEQTRRSIARPGGQRFSQTKPEQACLDPTKGGGARPRSAQPTSPQPTSPRSAAPALPPRPASQSAPHHQATTPAQRGPEPRQTHTATPPSKGSAEPYRPRSPVEELLEEIEGRQHARMAALHVRSNDDDEDDMSPTRRSSSSSYRSVQKTPIGAPNRPANAGNIQTSPTSSSVGSRNRRAE